MGYQKSNSGEISKVVILVTVFSSKVAGPSEKPLRNVSKKLPSLGEYSEPEVLQSGFGVSVLFWSGEF